MQQPIRDGNGDVFLIISIVAAVVISNDGDDDVDDDGVNNVKMVHLRSENIFQDVLVLHGRGLVLLLLRFLGRRGRFRPGLLTEKRHLAAFWMQLFLLLLVFWMILEIDQRLAIGRRN